VKQIPVSQQQMNLILMAVEHGFREHERGKNLQGALASVFEIYRVNPSMEVTIGDVTRGEP
jgi:hypothetical protein